MLSVYLAFLSFLPAEWHFLFHYPPRHTDLFLYCYAMEERMQNIPKYYQFLRLQTRSVPTTGKRFQLTSITISFGGTSFNRSQYITEPVKFILSMNWVSF